MSTRIIYEYLLPNNKKFIVYNNKPDFSIWELNQTHSCIITDHATPTEADGLIISTNNQEIPAIKTADCLPILIIGVEKMAFVHAGWRGVHGKIVQNREIQNIRPYYAFIGPHIYVDNFEVQRDFKTYFPESKNFVFKNGKIYFDLQTELTEQLRQIYPNINVQNSGICTYKNLEFNSYRRDQTKIRNYNIIK